MDQTLEALFKADWIEITILGVVINFAIYFGSMALYAVLSHLPGAQEMGSGHPVSRSDVMLSIVTVISNTAVFIFGVYLWKYGFIKLAESKNGWYILAEVLALTLVMDLLMYIFHRAVHFVRYFSRVHERHHEQVESIGFGLMMLAVICMMPFSAAGISIYLALNSLWGTVEHLNRTVLPLPLRKMARKAYICTSEFHYLHHQHPGYNFGFYSSVWDVIFKTIHPSSERNK